MCVHVQSAQLLYMTQHRTIQIIFPFNHQTKITAQVLSTGGKGDICG